MNEEGMLYLSEALNLHISIKHLDISENNLKEKQIDLLSAGAS